MSFAQLVMDQESITITPTYTPDVGWDTNFKASDIAFFITDSSDDDLGSTIDNSNGTYDDSTHTFTLHFTVNGVEATSQVIYLRLLDGTFLALRNADNTTISPPVIPPIDITLSKKVSAGAITTAVDTTVEFVSLGVPPGGPTIDFSPTNLPDGVTYILTDNSTPQKKWELYKDGFNGKVTAVDHYDTSGNVTFTQTFYLYGEEITGANSKRTVVIAVTAGFGVVNFSSITSDSSTVTLKYP